MRSSESIHTSAEREADAIKRLLAMTPYRTRSHAILWNTIARASCVRDCMEQTTFAKWFVRALRTASWFKSQRIAAFIGRYTNVTSSHNRRAGNERRRAKRMG
jgi:hypothetical protein